jgi:uncharacterized membrane protein YidH (DUF202 family)
VTDAANPADDRGQGSPETAGVSDAVQAAERTHLSWRRTVLSGLAVVLLAASKVVLTAPRPVGGLIVWFMILSWLAIGLIARRRMASLRAGRPVLINRSPAVVALLVTAVALLAALLLY